MTFTASRADEVQEKSKQVTNLDEKQIELLKNGSSREYCKFVQQKLCLAYLIQVVQLQIMDKHYVGETHLS